MLLKVDKMYSLLKKIPLAMVIGQQMKEEGMIKINNRFYI